MSSGSPPSYGARHMPEKAFIDEHEASCWQLPYSPRRSAAPAAGFAEDTNVLAADHIRRGTGSVPSRAFVRPALLVKPSSLLLSARTSG